MDFFIKIIKRTTIHVLMVDFKGGMRGPVKETGLEYLPAGDILRGEEDSENVYWNSFLPIFFDRLNYLSRKKMFECVKEYGLTSAHAYYLIALNLRDGMTLAEMSRFLDMDMSNTHRAYSKLLEKGLVCTDRKTEKSKKFYVFLTLDGKKLADRIMHDSQQYMDHFLNGIPKKDLDVVKSTLIKMLSNADPDFMDYIDHPLMNPFYTYLGISWPQFDPNITKSVSSVNSRSAEKK